MSHAPEQLTHKQEAAIVALLAHGTVRQAAQECGVSERTLWRWLKVETFQRELRAARVKVTEVGIAALQSTFVEGVAALKRNLQCGEPRTEVAAARVVVSASLKAHELQEVQARLDELEEAADLHREENKFAV